MTYQIATVTKVPDPLEDPRGGNMAAAITYGLPPELAYLVLINGRVPVFTLGEILILDEDDRDVGTTRKPSKWSIEITHFDNLDAAIRCSKVVQAGGA